MYDLNYWIKSTTMHRKVDDSRQIVHMLACGTMTTERDPLQYRCAGRGAWFMASGRGRVLIKFYSSVTCIHNYVGLLRMEFYLAHIMLV